MSLENTLPATAAHDPSEPPRFAVLTEYELGHAVTAIQWIARSAKPIAGIGTRSLAPEEVEQLAADLAACIELSGEPVRGFVMEEEAGWWRYGFYRHPWALDALLFLRTQSPCIQGTHRHWIQGLLYGYDSHAIERFISSERDERASSPPACGTAGMVGIYALPESTVLPCSSPSDRFQKPG